MRGNTEVVRLLLASTRRADIDNQDIQGSSALHIAATHDNKDVVEILLEKGAKPRYYHPSVKQRFTANFKFSRIISNI